DLDRAAGSGLLSDPEKAGDLHTDTSRVRDHSRMLFSTLQMLRFEAGGSTAGDARIRIRAAQTARLGDEGLALISALEAVEADIALTRDAPEEVLALARRAGELREDVRFLLRADDPDYVYFLEVRGRGVYLRASPIDVSDILREMLLDRMKTLVLTSATLTSDGSFEYVRTRLGIRDADEI